MFKSSYCRGVLNALEQAGYVAFPDVETACKVASYIANESKIDPLAEGGITPQMTGKIAEAIVDASTWFKNKGYKTAAFSKLASLDDLQKLAHQHTMDLMQKAAEGSTIEGGDKGNTEKTTAEGKMDEKARPDGYAENSRGKTEVDVRPGQVGKEEEHPNKPSETPSGDNSVKEQSRTAALLSFIKKTAEGSTILGGDKGNKEPTTAEGKMDTAMRPPGYAVLPSQGSLGELMARFDGQSAVGKEAPHPNAPANSPSGSNSIIETSHKNAEDEAYLMVFKKTASEVGQYLPTGISDDVKVAHVRACMGMTNEERAHYLHGLQKEAADKTAAAAAPAPDYGHYNGRTANQKQAEMPAFIQDKIDAKKEEGSEKKDEKGEKKDENPFAKKDDEKKEEKKEDEKEGSLASHLRRIASAIQPRA